MLRLLLSANLSVIFIFLVCSQTDAEEKPKLEKIMQEPWFIQGMKPYTNYLNFMITPSETLNDPKNAELIDDLKIIIESNFIHLLDYENRQISHVFLQRRKVAAKLSYNHKEALRYISQSSLEYKEAFTNILRKNIGELDVAEDNRYVYDANIHKLIQIASRTIEQNFNNLKGRINTIFSEAQHHLKSLKTAYKSKRRSKIFYLQEPPESQVNTQSSASDR